MIRATALLLLLCSASFSSEEAETLAVLARTAPPEFAADALLLLAEDESLGAGARVEWAVEAFRTAVRARDSASWIRYPGRMADSVNGLRGNAARLGLDALTLRGRAVRVLLKLDKRHAYELFAEYGLPDTPAVPCRSEMVPDPAAYFETVREVIGSVRTDADRDLLGGKDRVALLTEALRLARHPMAVAAAIELLTGLALSPEEVAAVAPVLGASLAAALGGDRSFTAAQSRTARVERVAVLLKEAEIDATPLVAAYRTYLVRHLQSDRCAEATEQATLAAAEKFDQMLTRLGLAGRVAPIDEEESRPRRLLDAAEDEMMWDSPHDRRVLRSLRQLRFNANDEPYTASEKASLEWLRWADEVVLEVEEWQPEGSALRQMFLKWSAYSSLIDVLPEGAEHQRAVSLLIAFLVSSYEEEHHVEWYELVTNTAVRSRDLPAQQRELIWNAFAHSGNPALALRAAIERWRYR